MSKIRSPLFLLWMLSAVVPLAARQKPPQAYSIALPPRGDFSALGWLVGEWSGKTSEKSPPGKVHLSVSYTLDRRFLLLKEEVSLAATESAPATDESWMGVLSTLPSGKGYALRIFSSTGFITRYRVGIEKGGLSFYPEGGDWPPPGWLFRRSLARTGAGQITESVEAAPPDHSFFNYYTATLTQQNSPTPPAQATPPAAPHPQAAPGNDHTN